MTIQTKLVRFVLAGAVVAAVGACQRDADDFVLYKPGVYQGKPDTNTLSEDDRARLRTRAQNQGG